jgi:hypothetical protein
MRNLVRVIVPLISVALLSGCLVVRRGRGHGQRAVVVPVVVVEDGHHDNGRHEGKHK